MPDTRPNTALLWIDVQESFRHRAFWTEAELPAFLAHGAALIAGCQAQGLPIVRVLHVNPGEDATDPFTLASGQVHPLAGGPDFHAAHTVHKHRHSALVGTGLGEWLRARGLTRLIVAGIRTEQCCETTTRHASDEGWTVDFVTDATLTFAMTTPAGTPLSSAQIRERTATMLAGRFATLCSVDQALARAGHAGQAEALA